MALCGANFDANGDGRVDNTIDSDRDGVPDMIDSNPSGFGGIRDAGMTGKYRVYFVFLANNKSSE